MLQKKESSCWGYVMPVHYLKISDCAELLKKHFLSCEIRPASYLKRVAERRAINDAVGDGWLINKTINGEFHDCLTLKGNELVNGRR